MVKRCGYYTNGTAIFQKIVDIAWDEGFDLPAKRIYIKRMQEALGGGLFPCVDVTTASPISRAKELSPHILKYKDGNPVGDLYEDMGIPGIYDFIYLNCLTEEQIRYVCQMKCVFDVFHNPVKGGWTQAHSLTVLKLAVLSGKLDLFKNPDGFITWYNSIPNIIC